MGDRLPRNSPALGRGHCSTPRALPYIVRTIAQRGNLGRLESRRLVGGYGPDEARPVGKLVGPHCLRDCERRLCNKSKAVRAPLWFAGRHCLQGPGVISEALRPLLFADRRQADPATARLTAAKATAGDRTIPEPLGRRIHNRTMTAFLARDFHLEAVAREVAKGARRGRCHRSYVGDGRPWGSPRGCEDKGSAVSRAATLGVDGAHATSVGKQLKI